MPDFDGMMVKDSVVDRVIVAHYGSDYHRDKLMWDEDAEVRLGVARSGNVEQLVFLVNDDDRRVREVASERFNNFV